jgi:hypothetical protein
MGTFLENLKKDLEKGEFNSESAKKIMEINEMANQKISKSPEKPIKERLADLTTDNLKTLANMNINAEEQLKLKEEYEKKMKELNKESELLDITAALINFIDDLGDAMIDFSAVYLLESLDYNKDDEKYLELTKMIAKFDAIKNIVKSK